MKGRQILSFRVIFSLPTSDTKFGQESINSQHQSVRKLQYVEDFSRQWWKNHLKSKKGNVLISKIRDETCVELLRSDGAKECRTHVNMIDLVKRY